MYSVENVTVQGSPMEVLVFAPDNAGPYPGVVVAQHLPVAHRGLQTDPFTIDVGERLPPPATPASFPMSFTGGRPTRISRSSGPSSATTGQSPI